MTDDNPRLTASMGRRLASRRVLGGLSQAQMAERLGISRQYLSMLETDAERPSLDLLTRLATEYRVTLDWLVFGTEATQAA